MSESCLRYLEQTGEPALPFLQEAFQRDRRFDVLKIGLISVAGRIGTPEAMAWITTLLDHPDSVIVNWSAGVLGKCGHVEALGKMREAKIRYGDEPRIDWAIDELERRKASTSTNVDVE
jgi:hypothetical protein